MKRSFWGILANFIRGEGPDWSGREASAFDRTTVRKDPRTGLRHYYREEGTVRAGLKECYTRCKLDSSGILHGTQNAAA